MKKLKLDLEVDVVSTIVVVAILVLTIWTYFSWSGMRGNKKQITQLNSNQGQIIRVLRKEGIIRPAPVPKPVEPVMPDLPNLPKKPAEAGTE